ncbi:MAG: PilZ domain-containing protein [bacterium]|nr:PilZ domain-containing protein [bacterium]
MQPEEKSPDDSRDAHRFVSRVSVKLCAGGKEVEAVITDISSAGARVETTLPVEPGAIVKIHYQMPGRQSQNLLVGEMVRSTPGGFAIRFLPDEQQ